MSIDDIRAREQAATPGDWWVAKFGSTREIYAGTGRNDDALIALDVAPGNADFIANARQDIPRLLDDNAKHRAALDAVTKLHYQREDAEDVIAWSCMDGPCEHDDECPELAVKGCDECSTPEYIVQWPCPTVRAISEVLT